MTFQLFGNVVSMQSIKLAGNTRDSLLLSFKEAKVKPKLKIVFSFEKKKKKKKLTINVRPCKFRHLKRRFISKSFG